jgi:hypothetical protein
MCQRLPPPRCHTRGWSACFVERGRKEGVVGLLDGWMDSAEVRVL